MLSTNIVAVATNLPIYYNIDRIIEHLNVIFCLISFLRNFLFTVKLNFLSCCKFLRKQILSKKFNKSYSSEDSPKITNFTYRNSVPSLPYYQV